MVRCPAAILGAPSSHSDDASRSYHTPWAAHVGREELDFMATNDAHTLAAQVIAAGVGIGAVLGLIVGGIREVWLWTRTTP